MFVRNENFRSFIRLYPTISAIIAIHTVLFFFMFFLRPIGGNFIFMQGVGYNLLIAQGELWRLVTPIFMHAAPAHFLFNSFSLVLFGPALERMLGKTRFIFIYLLTGILANIATFYLGGLGYAPHLGASGAIYGLFGVYVYMVLYRKDLIDQGNSQVIMTILVIGIIMTFVNHNINIYAHLFGLIAGFALAPPFLRKIRSYSRQYSYPYHDDEISFNPNRWKKRRLPQPSKKNILWIIFAIIILIGILSR